MTTFQQAAEAAQQTKDSRAAALWVQAANSALAGGAFVKARSFIDAALIEGTLKGAEAGEAHLERARALVAVGDLTKARTDLDTAAKLVPQDPLIWLLSASLARRSGDLDRARTDIAEAARLSPDDASVALEAGNIAAMMGNDAAARTAWTAAVKIAPDGPQGKAAAKALEQFGASEPETPEPAAPPR
jgi:tetratricopeptide (TPR) repeat protein